MAIDQSFQAACCNRKVKLLCSFGGKFLHRPYDWTLRYAGGHSRIIAVPRDTTLPQLCQKLSHVFGAPVEIRYQLPNQEIDNLVSVYSVEDLEYMMEEFDKLAQPSAKLHVFLFTQSEIASILAPSELTLIDICDGGQEYLEAVKATFSASHAAAIYSCQIPSPKATHNSDVDSIPSSPAKGNLDPLSEEDQLGGSFAHPLSHPNNKKAFHLPYELQPLPSDNNHMDCNLGLISEKTDPSKLRHPLGALGLSEDTQASYGLFVSSPQSLLDGSLQQQQKQILDGDNFYAAKVFHSTVTFSLSNDASLSPPQTYHIDSLQQQNVLFAEVGDHIQLLHPSGIVGLSSISYNVLESLSHPQGYVKQAEGINNDLNVSTFDMLRSTNQLNHIEIEREGLFKAEQGDMLECWESYSTWVSSSIAEEFKQDESVPLAMIFGHGMDFKEENSRRMQQEIFMKILSYVSVDNHLHIILFEKDVLTYLSNILQNYVFDPGGD